MTVTPVELVSFAEAAAIAGLTVEDVTQRVLKGNLTAVRDVASGETLMLAVEYPALLLPPAAPGASS